MNWDNLITSLQETLGGTLPAILGALVILVAGWIIAIIIRAIVRRGLGILRINERLQEGTGGAMDVQAILAALVYYVVLLITLVAFFEALNLHLASAPLQSLLDKLLGFLPSLLAGVILAGIAWFLAIVLRRLSTRALAATRLDERLSTAAGMKPLSQSLGQVLYWVVLLLFLPGVLAVLGLQGLLEPIQGMVDKALNMVPNIIAAAVLALAGWFVAKLLRELVESLLAAMGADAFGQRIGLQSATMTLSRLAGLLVFVFVFVPALIASFDALAIDTISRPATEILATLMSAVPNLIGAAVVLGVAYFLARLVSTLATGLLAGLGFDALPARLGLGDRIATDMSPSILTGRVVGFFIMLFAAAEAARLLGFAQISDLVGTLIEFGGQVILGIVIIAVGLWLANLAYRAVSEIGHPNARTFAGLLRIAILGIVVAMGLRTMGIADDIINMAFGLTLGSVAVAAALSFGLGGREAAGRQMEHWLSRLRND